MQNKINQKVPIAKMDELITAIRESGGGGNKIYRHYLTLELLGSSDTPGAFAYYYSSDNTPITTANFTTIMGNKALPFSGMTGDKAISYVRSPIFVKGDTLYMFDGTANWTTVKNEPSAQNFTITDIVEEL